DQQRAGGDREGGGGGQLAAVAPQLAGEAVDEAAAARRDRPTREPGAQVVGQPGRRGVASVGRLGEGLQADGVHVAPSAADAGRRRRRSGGRRVARAGGGAAQRRARRGGVLAEDGALDLGG